MHAFLASRPASMASVLTPGGGFRFQSDGCELLYLLEFCHTLPRRSTDPENRYPGCSLLPFEQLAEELVRFLTPPPRVTRTRDAIQFDWQGEKGAVVLIAPEEIQTRIPRIEWLAAYDSRRTSRLDSAMKVTEALSEEGFQEIFKRIRNSARKRLSLYRTCRFCGELFPPEYGDSRGVCDMCVEKHLGFIY
jgi:hypothetical protein